MDIPLKEKVVKDEEFKRQYPWLREIYENFLDSSTRFENGVLEISPISDIPTLEEIFCFDPYGFLGALDKYSKNVMLSRPKSVEDESYKQVAATRDGIYSLLQEFDKLKPKLRLGINQSLDNIKNEIEKYFNQFDKLSFYWSSYIKNHSDSGFRLSLEEVLEIKNYRDVFFEWELNSLLGKFVTGKINKDFLIFELKELGSRYMLNSTSGLRILDNIANLSYKYKTKIPEVNKFLNLYEACKRKLNTVEKDELDKKIENLLKDIASYQKVRDLKFANGRLCIANKEAFYQLLLHLYYLKNSVENFVLGSNPNKYHAAISRMEKFFKKPEEFQPVDRIRNIECKALKLEKKLLYDELSNYKLKVNGKIKTYHEFLYEFLNKLREKVNDFSSFEIVSGN